MKRRFHVITGGSASKVDGSLRPMRLYRAFSIGEIERDRITYYGVRFHWYRLDRTQPLVPFERLIAGFDRLEDTVRRQAVEQVLRYLTEEEVWGLRTYLRERHGLEVIAEEAPLPIEVPTGPFQSPYGEVYEFLELSEEEGYALPYKIWGYYTLRGCLSGPNLKDGVRFLQKAMQRLKIAHPFQLEELEGVVKAVYFEEGLVVRSRDHDVS